MKQKHVQTLGLDIGWAGMLGLLKSQVLGSLLSEHLPGLKGSGRS